MTGPAIHPGEILADELGVSPTDAINPLLAAAGFEMPDGALLDQFHDPSRTKSPLRLGLAQQTTLIL